MSDEILRPSTSQDITTSGTSATLTNAMGAQTYVAMLGATAACRFRVVEAAGGTAVATDTYLPANYPILIKVTPGQKIAAIQEAAGGKLNVTEMVS